MQRIGDAKDWREPKKKQEQKAAVWLWLLSSRSPEIVTMEYEDGLHIIVRLAALGRAILRRDKAQHEAATMNTRFLFLRYWAPASAGPGRPLINPQISDRSLKRAYHELATIILELSKPLFKDIGAIVENDGGFAVSKGPLTFNMNELMASTNLPDNIFPSKTFKSAVESLPKTFLARFLFLNITKGFCSEDSDSPFRLYCDNSRPPSFLIDLSKFGVSAVIDWEFTYAAPAEFTYVAPWLLLLQSPEDWEAGLNEETEETLTEQGLLSHVQRLSTRMARSMETGLFWTFIDRQYHGTFTSLDNWLHLLSDEQQRELTETVALKMRQFCEEKVFHDHYPIDELLEL
ncbi:hypothetical protein BDV12DRAFT_207347 [Aspergillus spectabilis]